MKHLLCIGIGVHVVYEAFMLVMVRDIELFSLAKTVMTCDNHLIIWPLH